MQYVDDEVMTSVHVHLYMLTVICFCNAHNYNIELRVFCHWSTGCHCNIAVWQLILSFNWVVFDYRSGKSLTDLSSKIIDIDDDKVSEFFKKVSAIVALTIIIYIW